MIHTAVITAGDVTIRRYALLNPNYSADYSSRYRYHCQTQCRESYLAYRLMILGSWVLSLHQAWFAFEA